MRQAVLIVGVIVLVGVVFTAMSQTGGANRGEAVVAKYDMNAQEVDLLNQCLDYFEQDHTQFVARVRIRRRWVALNVDAAEGCACAATVLYKRLGPKDGQFNLAAQSLMLRSKRLGLRNIRDAAKTYGVDWLALKGTLPMLEQTRKSCQSASRYFTPKEIRALKTAI